MLVQISRYGRKTTHVGLNTDNDVHAGFPALYGCSAPSNRYRSIGDHTILTKFAPTLSGLCEKLNMIPINRLVRLAPEHLGMRV